MANNLDGFSDDTDTDAEESGGGTEGGNGDRGEDDSAVDYDIATNGHDTAPAPATAASTDSDRNVNPSDRTMVDAGGRASVDYRENGDPRGYLNDGSLESWHAMDPTPPRREDLPLKLRSQRVDISVGVVGFPRNEGWLAYRLRILKASRRDA